MADIAALGFAVDSRPLVEANKELQKLPGAAARAEAASIGFGAKASAAAKRVANDNRIAERSAVALGGAYARLASIISGVFASALAALSLRKFIAATVEADQVQAQLASAIRSTGGAAGQSLATLNAHAAALQKVTNFGDDATNGAQAFLLTFTKIRGDVFPKATEAVQNVATAMGGDLNGAALQVGKALNDPVLGMTALSRSGIQFTESQKKAVKQMVATNNIAGAQALILKELETQFGGSARAARETLGGALTSLGNAWGDLFELGKGATEPLRKAIEALIVAIQNPAFVAFVQTIGAALFGAFQVAVMGATALVNGINVLVDNIDTIGVAAGTAGALMLVAFGPAILAGIVSGFVTLGAAGVTAIRAITAAMLANPLGALAVGITAAVTAVYYFRDEIQKAIGTDVVAIAKSAANLVIGSFVAAYEDIKFVWNSFPDIISAAVVGAVNMVIDGVNTMVSRAKEGINVLISALNSIPGIDIGMLDTAGAGIAKMENPAAGRLSGAVDQRNAAVNAAMTRDYIGEIGAAFEGSTPAAQEFSTALAGVNDNLGGSSKAAEKAEKAAKAYAKIVEGARQFIAEQNMEREAFGMSEQAANALRYEQELLNQAKSAGIKLSAGQAAELRTLAGEMAAAEQAEKALQTAQDAMNEAGQGFGSILRGLLDGTTSWKDALLSAIPILLKLLNTMNLAGGGKGIFGGGFFQSIMQGFLGFAGGGYTGNGPTNAAAGVVHGKEYVFSAAATKAIGVGNLDAMHRSARGYASGGFVAPARMQAPANDEPLKIVLVSRFDADGGFESAVERTSRPIAKQESSVAAGRVARAVPGMAVNAVDDRQFRRLRPAGGM